jgi:hypothetical protein
MSAKIRTTVYLPEDLVQMVRWEAVSRNVTMTELMEAGLRREIGVEKKKRGELGTYNLGKYAFKRSDAYE